MDELCSLCDCPLDGSEEHPLLRSLGGRKSSRRVLCAGQNNAFGTTIDSELAGQFAVLCNILGVTSHTLRNVRTADGSQLDLAPGGVVLAPLRIEDSELKPGTRNLRIIAGNIDRVRQVSAQYVRRYGKELAELKDSTLHQTILPMPAPVEIMCSLGGAALRSIAKTGFLFLACEAGTSAVRGEDTLATREFINSGGNPVDVLRHDYVTALPDVREFCELPGYAHRVCVFASSSSRVACAMVELFGTFRFTTLISESWRGRDIAYFHGVDPVGGKQVDVRRTQAPPISGASFREIPREIDVEPLKPRLERLFDLMRKRQNRQHMEAMADDVINTALPPTRYGTLITNEDIAKMAHHAAALYMARFFGQPHSKELDVSDLMPPASGDDDI